MKAEKFFRPFKGIKTYRDDLDFKFYNYARQEDIDDLQKALDEGKLVEPMSVEEIEKIYLEWDAVGRDVTSLSQAIYKAQFEVKE